jgi:hypothetical protein
MSCNVKQYQMGNFHPNIIYELGEQNKYVCHLGPRTLEMHFEVPRLITNYNLCPNGPD